MTILGILLLAGAYFLPTLSAWSRKNHTAAIFALNLFLGWTGIGWVVALVMALWSNNARPVDRATVPVIGEDLRVELSEIADYFRKPYRRLRPSRDAETPRPAQG